MSCIACAASFCPECYEPRLTESGAICCCLNTPATAHANESQQVSRGGPVKDDDAVTDVKSTGRKRAAVAYPITDGMICEWTGLKYAGGNSPIIGCPGNKATHRHHGPDKNTLNNAPGNVHRICVHCHNRWHAQNDNQYAGVTSPHDSETKATPEEVVRNEVYWSTKKIKKGHQHDNAAGEAELILVEHSTGGNDLRESDD